MTSTDAAVRKLDLGRVFGDTFGVIRRQAGPLIAVTLALGFLPALIGGLVRSQWLGHTPGAVLAMLFHPLYWAIVGVNLVVTTLLMTCQLQIAIGDLEGRSAPFAEVMRRAAAKMLPVLAASVLMYLGVVIGLMLFLVPGVIVAVMWVVALPTVVADTSHPIRALGRSRALTRGNRWRIFGLCIVTWVVLIGADAIILGSIGGLTGLRSGGYGLPSIILSAALSFLIYIVGSVGIAALYVQLRELKGLGGESVAQVFA